MRLKLACPTTLKAETISPAKTHLTERRNASLLGASTALALLLGLPSLAQAAFIPPAGVPEYRLIFITADQIAGTSSSIATYNNFATSEAALNPSLPSTVWTAVASTDSISAVNNIACTPACTNIPIYLVDGTEVAASSTALFNAATTSLLAGIGETQNGGGLAGYAWTGSFSTGLPAITAATSTDSTLGSAGGISEYGLAGNTDGTAIDNGSYSNSTSQSIYAISGVIAGSQPVPEPVSASLLAVGGLATGWFGRNRRQRKPANAV